MGLLFFGVIAAALSLDEQFGALRSSSQDNVEWTVSQLDVDLLQLMLAVQRGRSGTVEMAEIRKRFDIFFSRVRIVQSGDGFADLRADPTIAASLSKVSAFLDQAALIVDAPEPEFAQQIDRFDARLSQIRQDVRSLSTDGVRIFAQRSKDRRNRFVDALRVSSFGALALIILLGVLLVVLEYLRRLAQRKSQESERNRKRLVATNEAALEAIIVANHEGKITDWNQGAEAIFGLPADQAIGQEMSELIVPHRLRAAHLAGMQRYLSTGKKRVIDAGRVELSALRSDGTEFPVELAIATADADEGPVFISYMRDISDRVQAQRELTQARDDALAGDRAKSRFLAVMSHEMRTPLNGVLGLMDLLKHTNLTPEQRRHVETAELSGEVLLRHLNDVLDITRLEAGRLDLEAEAVDLHAIVDQVLEIGKPLCTANGNTIETRLDQTLTPVMGDPHRLRQTLLNLVGNAAKFTKNGRIEVAAEVVERNDDTLTVEMSIFNTGVPIPARDRARVFEDFVTLDDSYGRANSGTGLGLAISKRVVESMGGKIGLTDSIMDGNRFWFRVPFAASVDHRMAPRRQVLKSELPETALTPKRLLLVEDNALNRQIAVSMLTDAGHSVIEADNGLSAVDHASRSAFDAILMDISMPVMTGLEATHEIRRRAGPCQHVPIIGLTAHALPEETQSFIDAGMQICLTKPVRRRSLLTTIDRLTSGSSLLEPLDVAEDPSPVLIDEDVFSDFVLCLEDGALRETLSRVGRELEEGCAGLVEAARKSDTDMARSLAHRLSGTAALIGARQLHRALSRIEDAAKSGADAELQTLVQAVKPVVCATKSTLQEFASP